MPACLFLDDRCTRESCSTPERNDYSETLVVCFHRHIASLDANVAI